MGANGAFSLLISSRLPLQTVHEYTIEAIQIRVPHRMLTDQESADAVEAAEVARLCTDYLALAVKLSRPLARLYPWLADDLESEATLALLKAARTRHSWKAAFATLVRLQVARKCLALVRADANRPDSPGRVEACREEHGRGLYGSPYQQQHRDPVSGVVDDAPSAELIAEVRDLLGLLPPERRKAIERHFFDGETWVAMGAERGVTGNAEQQARARDLATMRAAAEQHNEDKT
jgi:DNA-directed RNA polymerase specialized sigma24 family protein